MIKKRNVLKTAKNLYEGRELVVNAFKSELFLLKSTTGTGLKILTPKQLLQILPIAFAQINAGNNWESLLGMASPSLSLAFFDFYRNHKMLLKATRNKKKNTIKLFC